MASVFYECWKEGISGKHPCEIICTDSIIEIAHLNDTCGKCKPWFLNVLKLTEQLAKEQVAHGTVRTICERNLENSVWATILSEGNLPSSGLGLDIQHPSSHAPIPNPNSEHSVNSVIWLLPNCPRKANYLPLQPTQLKMFSQYQGEMLEN